MTEELKINYGGAELLAVPSAHFNHIFASAVNRICADPSTRPEAIAVELGPNSAVAVRNWLQALGVCSETPKKFPVMLGLLKRNSIIRNSLREKVIQFQKKICKDLSECPPDMLYQELGITGYSLICLSPVDSIVEAIRCSIELRVPLYGVDLSNIPDATHGPVVIQDPQCASGDMVSYITSNAPFAEEQRDEEIDTRREIVMAARLKALLKEFQRVLFVCGMAHWLRIRKFIDDPSIQPSLKPEEKKEDRREFTRVVVHPLIAIKHTDLFPGIVREYENYRLPVHHAFLFLQECFNIEPAGIFSNYLNKAYQQYFLFGNMNACSRGRLQDLERFHSFEEYLKNTCLLNNKAVPDLFKTVRAAQQTMSKDFTENLVKIFMDFPWATPEEFPDCEFIGNDPGDGKETGHVVIRDKKTMQIKDHIYIRSAPYKNLADSMKIPYEWDYIREVQKSSTFDLTNHTWLPWDRLITYLSYEAMKNSMRKQKVKKAVVFEGSTLDGIDLKATIREYSKGKDEVYVRDFSKENVREVNPFDGYPIVWILQTGQHRGAEWSVLYEPFSYMEKYIRNKEHAKNVKKDQGSYMVAIISYGHRERKSSVLSMNSEITTEYCHGILSFQPICWTNKQYARWAELTGYKRNPFCEISFIGNGISGKLDALYRKRLGVEIKELDWATTLILFALPFSKDVLTVVIPDDYRIDGVVYEKAKKCGVEICTSSLSAFSREEIERLSLCYLVPTIVHDPECIYSEEIEKATGELQTDNIHLVPQPVLDFGNEMI